jgi:hypothetical protein
VSETAKEPPQDEDGMNCPQNLSIEATYVNQNFSQQMLLVRRERERERERERRGEERRGEERRGAVRERERGEERRGAV